MCFKKIIKFYVLAVVVLLVFIRCETDNAVSIDLDAKKTAIVVYGDFEADSSLNAVFYKSEAPLGQFFHSDSDYRLKNVGLSIYLGNEEVESIDSTSRYISQVNFKAGKEYRAVIYCEGYDTVYTHFYAPSKVRIDSVIGLPVTDTNFIKILLWFNDEPVESNFYGVDMEVLQQKTYFMDYSMPEESLDSMVRDYPLCFYNIDPLLNTIQGIDLENLLDYTSQRAVPVMNFDDELIQGASYGIVLLINRDPMEGSGVYLDMSDTLLIKLTNIEEGYYQHMEAAQVQIQNLNNGFSQLQNIPSNIENGYGYLGGYSTDYFKIAVKDLVNETKTK